jgi:hypothetical protein
MIAMRTLASSFQVRLAGLLGVVLLSAASCGLLNSDITKVTFALPTKHYVFTAPTGLPTQAVPCASAAGCPPAVGNVSFTCDNAVCTAHVPVVVAQPMNLKSEVSALSSVNSQTLADITLESMSYVVDNTTDVALPELSLYLAPDKVTDPMMAQKFGTVPAVPAKSKASGNVVKEQGADALFIMYGQNFGTSFTFIASTTIVIPSGTAATGTVDITIDGKVAAKLSL